MNKLEKIRDEIIKKAFPELKEEDIQIEYKKLDDALVEWGALTGEGFYLEVDEGLKNAPRDVLEGGIAHDLCHVVSEKEQGRFESWLDGVLYRNFKRYMRLDERNTDVEAVLRGYGQQLLTFLEYAEKEGHPRYREDGLSIIELQKLLSTGTSK
jgi:hypothetical protein